jgi:chromosome segregation ATPase
MMHPIDPWGPGPTRPDDKGTESEGEPQAETAQPRREAAVKEDQPDRQARISVPRTNALAREKARSDKPSAFTRAIGAARVVLPVVQKVLPLLEGNVASAAANLLTPSARPVDLEPVRSAIAKLQAQQQTLRGQIADQRLSLSSIEAELSTIKEGIDRNSRELHELAEDQLNLRRRLSRFMWTFFILLFLSIGITTLVFVRLAYILRL